MTNLKKVMWNVLLSINLNIRKHDPCWIGVLPHVLYAALVSLFTNMTVV